MYENNEVVRVIHTNVWMPIDLACNLSAPKTVHKVVTNEVWRPVYYVSRQDELYALEKEVRDAKT